ncbi:MAG: 2,3-bisphosphoglycerate-independent phosphoglycerate mutase, partial [Myxococcales bacterium]|nr:2,3-bisphosphoglycerate-independent phosphoglycerate mutase [Myxococcales bacterium]
MERPKGPVVLCLLDGIGEPEHEDNPVSRSATPTLDRLRREGAFTQLGASGPAVGLREGQPGRGDHGYLTLGAGRVLSPRSRDIDEAVAQERLGRNPTIDRTFDRAAYFDRRVHLIGLIGGDNHAQMSHLFALLDLAEFHGVKVWLHAILDGRDGRPRTAAPLLDKIETYLGDNGRIATIGGRHWAMDRAGRWDRVHAMVHAMVRDNALGPEAPRAETPWSALAEGYARGEDDGTIKPVRIGDYQGFDGTFVGEFSDQSGRMGWEWRSEDWGLAFNQRGDGMEMLSSMLTLQGVPEDVQRDLLEDLDKPIRAFSEGRYAALTDHGEHLDLHVAYDHPVVEDTLADVIARAGLRQFRCAEAERRWHVGRYFRGGRRELHADEREAIIRSPQLIDRYEEEPELSLAKVEAAVLAALADNDFVTLSLPNASLVSQEGPSEAAERAIAAMDATLGRVAEAVQEAGGVLLVTAPHGGCETPTDDEGEPRRGHSRAAVPLAVLGGDIRALRAGGSLVDVAPTILALLGLEA